MTIDSPPPDSGLDALRSRLPQTASVLQHGAERGLHTAGQLYLSLHGEIIVNAAWGEAQPGVPMTPDTINLWLSAGKPLTAAAFARCWEAGQVRLDDPVASVIPEFARSGKEAVTFRHLLTHTAGLRHVETGWPDLPWDETIARICASPLDPDAFPGRTAGYHTQSSWFLLGETLQRLAGETFTELLRNVILIPAGLTETRAAIATEEYAEIAPRLGWLYERDRGTLRLLDWHTPERCAAPAPGSNLRGPIRDLGRFYEMLHREGQGPAERVLSPQTVAALTARHRVGELDLTLGHVVDFGLGVILDSNRYGADTVPYGYGRYCSPRTFGHGGAQSSQGFCDPERGLVVAWLFNGRAGEGLHNRRTRAVNEAIYQDLGLADAG